MSLLKKAENNMAFVKCGILGFQSSGKTFTATRLAIGLAKMIKAVKIGFVDTETGSDWLIPLFRKAEIELLVSKTRAYQDLLTVGKECVTDGIQILIVDSITHIWRNLCEGYLITKGKKKMEFQDWNIVKTSWNDWTDFFINSEVHIFVLGRAGHVYDWDYDEEGNKDLVKVGTKMKAENEFGFEPSLGIEMEQITVDKDEYDKLKKAVTRNPATRKKKQGFVSGIGSEHFRRAHVLKDRSVRADGSPNLDGMIFDYRKDSPEDKVFNDFLPHFQCINFGGTQIGLDTSRNSEELFGKEGKPQWKQNKDRAKVALEELDGLVTLMFPTVSVMDKKAKIQLSQFLFRTTSRTKIEQMDFESLEAGLELARIVVKSEKNLAIFRGEIEGDIKAELGIEPNPFLDKCLEREAEIKKIKGSSNTFKKILKKYNAKKPEDVIEGQQDMVLLELEAIVKEQN